MNWHAKYTPGVVNHLIKKGLLIDSTRVSFG